MLALVLASSLAQPPTAPPPRAVAVPECRVLARGAGYVIHAVPGGVRAPDAPAPDLGPDWGARLALVQDSGVRPRPRTEMSGGTRDGRLAVLHTDLKTGAMTKLVEGGEWTVTGPPMGLQLVSRHTLTLAAAATGPDRLYVLAARTTTHHHDLFRGEGGLPRRPAQPQAVLYVFRLADGTPVQQLTLPAPVPRLADLAGDRLDPDLIRVTPTTVTVGATTFRIVERLEPVEPKP